MREQVEKELGVALTSFTMASLSMSEEEMNAALLAPARKGEIEVSLENIMSVNVPKIEFEEHEVVNSFYPYGMLGTVGELDVAVDKLASVLPSLVKLAQLEKTCNMLADEIEKTRRRVNDTSDGRNDKIYHYEARRERARQFNSSDEDERNDELKLTPSSFGTCPVYIGQVYLIK